MREVKVKDVSSLYIKSHKLPLKDLLGAEGNTKLPVTTAIFNISSATSCSSKKLGLCAAEKFGVKCYAKKSEDFRPQVLPYRNRQEKLWKSISAEDFAFQFLMINSAKRHPFSLLRLNESGDFRTQEDVAKAEEIARLLRLQGVKTYCYTSRSDLSFDSVKNLIISGSNFQKKGISGMFKIVKSKKDKPKFFGMCKMNCRICNRCQVRGKLTCVTAH